ncbi:hypothetical protein BK133_11160 [Paenibacillus sp. FSL H8-0548]|uniref:hypothetical protein n=1 Tax=Paenibacillus sp. FSL H8-0548 TaxID=1920422 RepID=UPI00096E1BD7|nr:hypothetical protein [Paenibacillus sp. FSL H8-0548]OMF35259.1 hypothetical protein BK133_11160 [Paenibacillus sp. FSL H8-0548]
MYPVSQDFKDAIYAPTMQTTGRVTFNISDVTAAGDVNGITTTTEQASISSKAQINNDIRTSSHNLATLEQDRFKLDGSFSFPDAAVANNGEVGFVSSALCGADGVFSVPQVITITFGSPHTSAGLTVAFDQRNDECATDFTASAYDASNALIQTVNVTGNTLALCALFGRLEGYKKIVLTITKWSAGNRRARVLEVDFGFLATYDDEKLISFNIMEDMDMTSGSLPSPEFRFTVDNFNRAFNILNPDGYVKYLQQRQEVIAEIGLVLPNGAVEYVPLGKYLLWDWTSDEGSFTASFSARTNLDLMANFFTENTSPSPQTLAQVATTIFNYCGISNYHLDSALSGIVTNTLVKNTDCRTIIQMIAIAGCCNLYVTRDNVITLKQVSLGTPVDRVDFDNIYSEPKIELERVVKQVDVTYWTDLETSVVATVTASGVDIGDVLKLEGNTLINTSAQASSVAAWIMDQKQYRAKYSINWRGNPAMELADVIAIENTYGGDMTAMITKTELTYRGYLEGRTESRGGVN